MSKVKNILSYKFGRDVGGIIEGYDERCDSDYDRCSMVTRGEDEKEGGSRCLYQAVYTKDIDNKKAKMSCKHYCRQHCDRSFKKLFTNLPTYVDLEIDGREVVEYVKNRYVEIEAGGGKLIMLSKNDFDEDDNDIVNINTLVEESQIIRTDEKGMFVRGRFSLCNVLAEYSNVKIKVNIEVELKRGKTIKIKDFRWANDRVEKRWIANADVWLNSVITLSNGLKKGIIFLPYSISHRDEKKECYTFKDFKLEVVDDEVEDIITELDYNDISGAKRFIYDLDKVLNKGISDNWNNQINKSNVPKLKEKIVGIYNSITDEYDKNRIANRYLNIFNESIDDAKNINEVEKTMYDDEEDEIQEFRKLSKKFTKPWNYRTKTQRAKDERDVDSVVKEWDTIVDDSQIGEVD